MIGGTIMRASFGVIEGLMRVVLTAALGIAGLSHVQNHYAHYTAVSAYRLLPPSAVTAVALYVPWLLVGLAVAIWSPRLRVVSGLVASVLLLAFVVVQGSAMWRGLAIDCGCFGVVHSETIGVRSLLRTLILAAVAIALTWWWNQTNAEGLSRDRAVQS